MATFCHLMFISCLLLQTVLINVKFRVSGTTFKVNRAFWKENGTPYWYGQIYVSKYFTVLLYTSFKCSWCVFLMFLSHQTLSHSFLNKNGTFPSWPISIHGRVKIPTNFPSKKVVIIHVGQYTSLMDRTFKCFQCAVGKRDSMICHQIWRWNFPEATDRHHRSVTVRG